MNRSEVPRSLNSLVSIEFRFSEQIFVRFSQNFLENFLKISFKKFGQEKNFFLRTRPESDPYVNIKINFPVPETIAETDYVKPRRAYAGVSALTPFPRIGRSDPELYSIESNYNMGDEYEGKIKRNNVFAYGSH